MEKIKKHRKWPALRKNFKKWRRWKLQSPQPFPGRAGHLQFFDFNRLILAVIWLLKIIIYANIIVEASFIWKICI